MARSAISMTEQWKNKSPLNSLKHYSCVYTYLNFDSNNYKELWIVNPKTTIRIPRVDLWWTFEDANLRLTRKKDIDFIRTTLLLINLYDTRISPRCRAIQHTIHIGLRSYFVQQLLSNGRRCVCTVATLWHTHEVFDWISLRCWSLLR